MTDYSAHGYRDPWSNPHLPLVERILLACWTDMDPKDVPGRDSGDGSYDEVAGLIGDHDWHVNLTIADVMGLPGDWGTDDVDQAVTNALHEYRPLRAEVEQLRARVAELEVTRGAAQMLAEFHEAFGQAFGHGNVANSTLRRKLHEEEFQELEEAHERLLAAFDTADLAAVAHELADVVYVAYGSAHSLGIPLDAVIAEVHRANMSKFDEHGKPVLRDDGKVLKSDRFVPADVASVLAVLPSGGTAP